MFAKFIAILFLSRDIAHREHLRTKIYAQHVALGDFYDAIIGLADSLTEMYQGRHGVIDSIPQLNDEDSDKTPAELLKSIWPCWKIIAIPLWRKPIAHYKTRLTRS